MLKTYLGQGVNAVDKGHGVLTIIGPLDQLIAIRQMIDVSDELLADHIELDKLRREKERSEPTCEVEERR